MSSDKTGLANSSANPLVLSLGDPAGIGPEITAKSWAALRSSPEHAFAVIAPPAAIERALEDAQKPALTLIKDMSEAKAVFEHSLPVIAIDGHIPEPGKPSAHAAKAITHSIESCVSLCLSGQAAGLVTNPIAKHILYESGFNFPGHTEYLGALTQNAGVKGPRGPVMMLSGGGLKVALATVHMPLAEAAKTLSQKHIIDKVRVMHHALRQDFGIENPHIALAGLNPHAGENGALGQEEVNIINPAAQKLRADGLSVTDAQPADTLFHAEAREGYDAVLAMYHDQGLIPVKTLDFHGGVNMTLGLPIIRTSPDHGTAFAIAGKSLARADSLIAAIRAARIMADNRSAYTHG